MSVAADRLWSAQQQAWLGALGHTLYVPADWPTEAGDASASSADTAGRASAGDVAATAPAPARPTRVAPVVHEDVPRVRATPPPRAPGARMPDRLHFALIRASGCNPNAPGAQDIFSQWPSSAELRGNPAAKRALWPQLRRLRRTIAP